MTLSPITVVIVAFMILIALYSKFKSKIDHLPSIVTTIGIFGTFLGICMGLRAFNVEDIEGSVPDLLEGLKIAFETSIVGIGFSIIIKCFPSYFEPQRQEVIHDDVSIEDFLLVLEKIQNNQKEISNQNIEQLQKIQKALSGDEDSTLLTQIQKLRTTISDKNDELLKEFRDFSQTIAENNSKCLIEALTHVMEDFNTQINEQLGENFKHLNEGIGKLLDWQDKYRNQVDIMIKQIEATIDSIDTCAVSLSVISEKSESFQQSASDLTSILEALNKDVSIINAQLVAIGDLSEKMQEAYPSIEQNLTKYTDGFSRMLDAAFIEHKKMLSEQKEKISDVLSLNQNSIEEQSRQLKEMQNGINTESVRLFSDLNSGINRLMNENAETITKQVKALDEQLGEELTKSLKTLGQQLTSLSGQFASDYIPLTEKLERIVRIAEDIDV